MTTSIVMAGLSNLVLADETIEFGHQYNAVQGSGMCVTVATSVLATFVIGARIYSSTAMNHRARRRYKHIVEIIVQSSALYSLCILLAAVADLVDNESPSGLNSRSYGASAYTATISFISTVCFIYFRCFTNF